MLGLHWYLVNQIMSEDDGGKPAALLPWNFPGGGGVNVVVVVGGGGGGGGGNGGGGVGGVLRLVVCLYR